MKLIKLLSNFLVAILLVTSFHAAAAQTNPLEDVKRFVQTIPQLRGQDLEVSSLSGGLTNRIYLIKNKQGQAYVLRVFGAEAASLGIDPATQADIATRVGQLAVGPQVVYVSADKKKMLIDFVAGDPVTKSIYNQQLAVILTQQLRKLHQQGNFDTAFHPFKTANEFLQTALHKSPEIMASFPLADMVKAHSVIQQIEIIVNPHSEKFTGSAHNDLHGENILFDADHGTIALLDLDYAGLSDIFFDLGVFANNMELNSEQSTQLLAAYFAPRIPTARDEAHLAIMRLVSTYWNAMWHFSQVGSSTIEHDYLQDAKVNLREFLQQTDTLAFKSWMKILLEAATDKPF